MNAKNRGQGSGVRGQGLETTQSPNHQISKSPNPSFPSAFTLVELLVVIVIISMLTGLLLPALIAARGRARVAQCTNNQHELALAITQYDVAKKRLPGYLNQIGGANMPRVGWVPVLLKYLGRNDLWADPPRGWRYGVNTSQPPDAPHIDQLVCPDGETTVEPALSYVLITGVYNGMVAQPGDYGTPVNTLRPIFRDYYDGSNGAISLSDVQSPSRTIMLSEKNAPTNRNWDRTLGGEGGLIAAGQRQQFAIDYGFSWPNFNNPILNTVTVSTSLPPIHAGIVIITFCDGHTESLSEETLCNTVLALP